MYQDLVTQPSVKEVWPVTTDHNYVHLGTSRTHGHDPAGACTSLLSITRITPGARWVPILIQDLEVLPDSIMVEFDMRH